MCLSVRDGEGAKRSSEDSLPKHFTRLFLEVRDHTQLPAQQPKCRRLNISVQRRQKKGLWGLREGMVNCHPRLGGNFTHLRSSFWTEHQVLLSKCSAQHGSLQHEDFYMVVDWQLHWSKGFLLQKIGSHFSFIFVFIVVIVCVLYWSPWTLGLWYAVMISAELQRDPASKFMPGKSVYS